MTFGRRGAVANAPRFASVAAVVVFLCAGRLFAFMPSIAEEHEIEVDAEEISYDQTSDRVNARGRVSIRRGELQLLADEVNILRSTNEADATGSVSLTLPEGVLSADQVYFNLDAETGFLRNVSIESAESRFSLFGEYAEKRAGQCYRIENGTFTTCRCPDGRPTWTLASESLEVDVGGYGTAQRSTFNLYDVPVLYLPWVIFPVGTDRQSGLLEPRFAVSNRRGLQILQPFYWAINKSHDATLALDVESSARLGFIGEHRYAASREIRGQWSATYFNEAIRGNPDGLSLRSRIPENRWSVRAEHDHRKLLGGTLYVDAFVVGDDGFLREINAMSTDYHRDVALRTLQFTDSRVGFIRDWDRFAVKLEGTYYQDIDLTGIVEVTPTVDGNGPGPQPTPVPMDPRLDSRTLQRAPSLEWLGQGRVAGPVLGHVSGEIVDFQRGNGSDGMRFDVEPALTLPLPLGQYAFGSVEGSARQTVYHLFERDESADLRLRQNPTRESFGMRTQLGTAVARVYPVRWRGFDALQHVLEPRFEHYFVPDVVQEDLPVFDGKDRYRARNLLSYGFASRFMARSAIGADAQSGSGQVRELGRLWLLQGFDIERRVPSVSDNVDRDDHFTDIDIGGAVHPTENLSVDFSSMLDHGAGNLTAAKVGVFVAESGDTADSHVAVRSRARLAYRFLTGNALQELHGDMMLRVTRWIGLIFATRYDVVQNDFIDRHFGMRLLSQCDCWALDFGLTDRTNPSEVEARVRFTLLGIDDAGFFDPGS